MLGSCLRFFSATPRPPAPFRLGVEELEERLTPDAVAFLPAEPLPAAGVGLSSIPLPKDLPGPVTPTRLPAAALGPLAGPPWLPLTPGATPTAAGLEAISPELQGALTANTPGAVALPPPLLFTLHNPGLIAFFPPLPQLPPPAPGAASEEGQAGVVASTAPIRVDPPEGPAAPPVPPAIPLVPISFYVPTGVREAFAEPSLPEPAVAVEPPRPAALGSISVADTPVESEPAVQSSGAAPLRALAWGVWDKFGEALPDLDTLGDLVGRDRSASAVWQTGVCLLAGAAVWALFPRRSRSARRGRGVLGPVH